MMKDESGSRITAALITAIAMIAVAIIGFFGIKIQTETPIYATLTALPSTVIVNQTVIVVTVNSPRFTVYNKLMLPIRVSVDGKYMGDVNAQSFKVFLMESYPAKITWELIKNTLNNGSSLGHDMSAYFESIYDNESITVDSIVDKQPYFYPILSNNTDKNCIITINESLESEYITNAFVGAHKENVRVGYFKLFTNSNLVLNCDGAIYWWGLRTGETRGTSFYDKAQQGTGIIYFTLNP